LGFASCAAFEEPPAACHFTPAPPSTLSDAWKSPWLRKIEKVKSAAVPTVV
jgi:hypothetical protein